MENGVACPKDVRHQVWVNQEAAIQRDPLAPLIANSWGTWYGIDVETLVANLVTFY